MHEELERRARGEARLYTEYYAEPRSAEHQLCGSAITGVPKEGPAAYPGLCVCL